MQYLAVLGREPQISLAELAALFDCVEQKSPEIAVFSSGTEPEIDRLGGSLKLAKKLENISPEEYLSILPEGKITLGLSDYTYGSKKYSRSDIKNISRYGIKIKQALRENGRSVRLLPNSAPVISTAAAHHNGLGRHPKKVELIKFKNDWYISIGSQNISAYRDRDQARPARDAKVGMLPPKLAQILINLCGPLPEDTTILDPFCGTGVVLQEAILMGYRAYGTDKDARMVEYTERNLRWAEEEVQGVLRGASARPVGLRPSASQGAVATGGRRYYSRCRAPYPLQNPHVSLLGVGDATTFSWFGKALRPFAEDTRESLGDSEGNAEPGKASISAARPWRWAGPTRPEEHPNSPLLPLAIASEIYLGPPMSSPPTEIKLKEVKQYCGAILTGFLKNLRPQITEDTPITLAIPAWRRRDGSFERLKTVDEIEKLGYNVMNQSEGGLLYARENQIVAREIIVLRKK